MSRFYSIGEALIDMIPNRTGVSLKEVESFTRTAGGAPANVCACVAQQGVEAKFIGKLGKDVFGDYLVDVIGSVGVATDYIFRSNEANTSLAFVSLRADGERDFSFYRKPGADMLLSEDDIDGSWFEPGDVLHFCSVDLIEAPVKYAHKKAIKALKDNGGTIVFDPNLRLPLWEDLNLLKSTVLEFINYADILKISDNELEFITGTEDVEEAAELLLDLGVQVFVYTMGSEGARIITKDVDVFCPAYKLQAIDATGAGDAFIGSLIANIMRKQVNLQALSVVEASALLNYSNACGAIVATKHGAIDAMPTIEEVESFMTTFK